MSSKLAQRIDRPGDIEQDRIGVVVHGQLDPAVAHGGHGCSRMNTGCCFGRWRLHPIAHAPTNDGDGCQSITLVGREGVAGGFVCLR